MAYDFSAVVNQMRSAGISQDEIDAFLREQERVDREFNQQFTSTKSAADTAFKTAQEEIAAMFSKEQELLRQQAAEFEASQKAAQERAAEVAAQAAAQQELIKQQEAEATVAFEAQTLLNRQRTEEVQRESGERIAGSRRARRSAGGRGDSLINQAMNRSSRKVPTLGLAPGVSAESGTLGPNQKLGVGG